jgi:hypothetical protein
MKKVLVFFLAMGFLAGVANAEFIDHGGGMIYDTDLKITWYDAPIIPRPYSEAINWVASLTLCNTVPNSWRFPSTPGTVVGCTDEGEMGKLYFDELQNKCYEMLTNSGPFKNNFQAPSGLVAYWANSTGNPPGSGYAWSFNFYLGWQQEYNTDRFDVYAIAVHDGDVCQPTLKVAIDIEPWFKPNIIDLKFKWAPIPVAILSKPGFDAPKMIDQASLTFGDDGDENSLAFCSPLFIDVNGDRLRDLICFFYTGKMGFLCGDTEGTLKGKTKEGWPIEGSDSVKIVPCK